MDKKYELACSLRKFELSHLDHDAGESEADDDKDEADEKPGHAKNKMLHLFNMSNVFSLLIFPRNLGSVRNL